ncbi:unnamed protein product, partial [Trichogramma brassicae]
MKYVFNPRMKRVAKVVYNVTTPNKLEAGGGLCGDMGKLRAKRRKEASIQEVQILVRVVEALKKCVNHT